MTDTLTDERNAVRHGQMTVRHALGTRAVGVLGELQSDITRAIRLSWGAAEKNDTEERRDNELSKLIIRLFLSPTPKCP
jgi:hypothetical protein